MDNENAVDQSQQNGAGELVTRTPTEVQVPQFQLQLHLVGDLMQCLSQTELLLFQDDLQAVINSWLRKKQVVKV